MNITQALFWILSVVALFSALMVVTSRNPVHSVLWLIVTFFAISGHYILLNAQFLAIVNIIVYAGAIMVLFLFVIMLMNVNQSADPSKIKTLGKTLFTDYVLPFEISSVLFLSAMVGAVIIAKKGD